MEIEYLNDLREHSERDAEGKWKKYTEHSPPGESLREDWLVRKYSWAIPNEEAIQTLVEHDPIIEVGAGNGYWAMLVKQAGGEHIATDIEPPERHVKPYTTVLERDHTVVEECPNATLFTCWPSHGAQWTGEMLDLYEGDTVIYIGEGTGGCTGDGYFHRKLMEDFGPAERVVDIPQWHCIRDKMFVFYRNDT